MAPAAGHAHKRAAGLWRPLLNSVFRSIWIATVASNIGGWVHEVAAQWLMTSLSASPLMVSLVETMSDLPVFLLSIAAGALADVIDRRRLLLGTQVWMLCVAAALGVLTLLGWVSPQVLLIMTFLLESGTAMGGPAWQAILPELVPHAQLRAAVTLNALAINLARAIGPAIGGLIVSYSGPATAFFLNAISFAVVAIVVLRWRRPARPSALPSERFLAAVRTGIRYVRYSPPLRAVLIRTGVFLFGASGLWALLPVVAKDELRLGPSGYGVLLACLGSGALLGTLSMRRIAKIAPASVIMSGATILYAASSAAAGLIKVVPLTWIALGLAGVGWVIVVSDLNVAAQAASPRWVRARAMSVFLLVFYGGMSAGSVIWGTVASRASTPVALVCAAGVLIAGVLAAPRFRLRPARTLDLSPAQHWRAPRIAEEPDPGEGPVLVTVEYQIDPARRAEFLEAMKKLRLERLRDGAFRWGIFQDVAQPDRYVETFVVESWTEHLRQHARVTKADKALQDQIRGYLVGNQPPVVRHLVYARA